MSGDALDLDALATLEQAASPAPWQFFDLDDGERWFDSSEIALIAALRNAAPALIAAARVSRDERRAAEDLADRLDRVAAERDAARAEVADLRERARAAYIRVLTYWHQADSDHCGGECFRTASIDAALATGADQ